MMPTRSRLMVFAMLLALFAVAAATTARAQPSTVVILPTPTLDKNGFDFEHAKEFVSKPPVVRIRVPVGWRLPDPIPKNNTFSYAFSFGAPENPVAQLQVSIEDATEFYNQVDSTGESKNGIEALNAFKKARGGDGTDPTQPKFGDVKPGKLGTLNAATLSISVPGNVSQNQPSVEYTFYIAELVGTGKIAFVQTNYYSDVDKRVIETLDKMVASIVITPGIIPTPTPTATLHPLLMSATALQTQIIGLTPTTTATITPSATRTPGPGTPTTGPVTITASGLKLEDLKIGTGATAIKGSLVTVKYKGYLADGTVFDSSYDQSAPNDVFRFKVGSAEVIKGWDEGIPGMRVGGKRKLTIPPDLAYGDQAVGKIPANSTLIFEVELVHVEN